MTAETDLAGKTILITGASSGIGLAASRQLAARGAGLVLVARDRARLDAAVEQVRAGARSAPVASLVCDLSSQASIRALAAEVGARYPRIDVLVNNAGCVNARRQVTVDGLERTFAVNHLGYFLLTNLLLDNLKAASPSRIVVVASAAHLRARVDFEDLQLERDYEISRAYSRSKLMNVLFTGELARRLAGTGVTVNALHPGVVSTRLWSGAPAYLWPVLTVAKWFMIRPERGAEAVVHLAAGADVEGQTGEYYDRLRPGPISPAAADEALAGRLWEASARLTGLG